MKGIWSKVIALKGNLQNEEFMKAVGSVLGMSDDAESTLREKFVQYYKQHSDASSKASIRNIVALLAGQLEEFIEILSDPSKKTEFKYPHTDYRIMLEMVGELAGLYSIYAGENPRTFQDNDSIHKERLQICGEVSTLADEIITEMDKQHWKTSPFPHKEDGWTQLYVFIEEVMLSQTDTKQKNP